MAGWRPASSRPAWRRSRSSRLPGSCASPRTTAAPATGRRHAPRRARISFDHVASDLEHAYAEARGRRRAARRHETEPLADREWIVTDLHMHTRWSHDCSIEPAALVDHAESEGLGAIAVTDHNVFGGALETVDIARGRELMVIPDEEVKTDRRRGGDRALPPRGDTAGDAVCRHGGRDPGAGGGRLRSAPVRPPAFDPRARDAPPTSPGDRRARGLQRAPAVRRLQRRGAAVRAQVPAAPGAGSDAHVLQGVGTGALRMRRFDGPEEFLLSLRTATVLRRPKSLALLQSLKWVAQVKERVGSG